jgi:lysyl-tRNA synthetase class 2
MEDHLRRLTPSFPRVFEIGKAIRAERRSASHAIEFLVLQLVVRDLAYQEGLDLIMRMVQGPIAQATDEEFNAGEAFRGLRARTWDEVCMSTLGSDSQAPDFAPECVAWLKKSGIEGADAYTFEWQILEDIMKYAIEPACREPTLITHFPRELQHVCDLNEPGDHALRFSLVMNGIEFADGGLKFAGASGYRRIYERNALYRKDVLGLEHNALPDDFFAELDAWPARAFTSGVGIDRLAALVADHEVSDVIQFANG